MPISIFESYWVIPGRFRAGEYPGSALDNETRARLSWLADNGIDLIIDLTEPGEAGLRPYSQFLNEEEGMIPGRLTYNRMPLQDFGTPAQEVLVEILDQIDLALSLGQNIYLHCYGGKGRTGTVVGCYLVRLGRTGIDALEMIHQMRKDTPSGSEPSPETEGQRRRVMEWKMGQ